MKILSKLDNTGMIDEVTDKKYVTDAEKIDITHTNRSVLDELSDVDGHLGYKGELLSGSGEGSYTLPQASETTLGGIKAKAKTTEVGEIAIDPDGKLFSPALPPTFYSEGEYLTEDFEDLEFVAPYTTSTWSITTADKKTGLKSIVSSKVYSQNYEIRFNLDVGFNGTLSFWYKVNKESNSYANYTFKLDGVTLINSMAAVPWTYFECPIAAGQHELYVRGSDQGAWWSQVFIDDLSFPGSRQYLHGIEDHSKMPSIFDNPGKLLKASDDGSALEFVPQNTFIKTPTEGTAGQVLMTDGAGERFWQTNDPIKLFSESGMATEDFEDAILLDNLSITGDYDFQTGFNSIRSLHHRSSSQGTFDTTITIDMSVSAEVSFYYKCSVYTQNYNWNEFSLLIDDELKFSSRVNTPWTKYSVELSTGRHTITLRTYSYVPTYWVEWWLDNLVVPGNGLTGMNAVSANADKLLATSIDGTHIGFLSKSTFVSNPATEGVAGQVLTTDGVGGSSWQTPLPDFMTNDGSGIHIYDSSAKHNLVATIGRRITGATAFVPLIPNMSANSMDGYIASASSNGTGRQPFYVFATPAPNDWTPSTIPNSWIGIEFPVNTVVKHYSITFIWYAIAWRVEGFDGSNWVTLDTVTGNSSKTVERTIANVTAYKKYRIFIIDSQQYLHVEKLQFYDATTEYEYGVFTDAEEESSYTLPQATETTLGGVKAKEKTTESSEVAIESATGKLFVPAPDEAENGVPGGGTTGQILSKIDETNYNAQWVDNPSVFSTAVAGGYSGSEEDFREDLASIEGLAQALNTIIGGI